MVVSRSPERLLRNLAISTGPDPVTSRRILQCNVTAQPTVEWTLQQLREAIPGERGYRFLIHDRDSIFAAELDEELTQGFGLRVLRTPPQSPQANAYCERLIGTMRRECLDFLVTRSRLPPTRKK